MSFSQKKQRGSFYRRIFGNIALRIFLVVFLLLIVPLGFHSIVAYRHEYRLQQKNAFFTLEVILKNRLGWFEKTQQFISELFIVLQDVIDFETLSRKTAKVDPRFVEIKDDLKASALFFLALDDRDHLICHNSSDERWIGMDFSDDVSYSQALKASQSIFFSDLLQEKNFVYAHQIIGTGGKVLGLLILTFDPEMFIDILAQVSKPIYPIHLSYISKEGDVVVSNNPLLINKKIVLKNKISKVDEILLESIPSEPQAYSMEIDRDVYLVMKEEISHLGGSILIDLNEKNLSFLLQKVYWTKLLYFLFFFFGIGGGLSSILIFWMARPIGHLNEIMNRIAKGEMSARYRSHFLGLEINTLGRQLNEMVDQILKHQREATEARIEKELLQEEFRIAQKIQNQLIQKPLSFPGLDIACGYLPAKEVGGDFYDIFLSNKEELAIAIADTSGKGISACLFALTFRSLLRSAAKKEKTIGDILQHTNELFCLDTGESGIFVTLWYGLYDPRKKILNYCNCGHFPSLLKRGNTLKELTSQGMALGAVKELIVESNEIHLEQGDTLFLYTDGIIETRNDKNQLFGMERFKTIINRFSNETSKQMMDTILEEIKIFSKGAPLSDDVTLVVMHLE